MRVDLTPEQEAEAGQLAQEFQEAAADELLQMARLLVSKDDRHLFGQTEFDLRALLLRVAAKAYTAHLQKKKGATRAPACPAPTAARRRSSRATATGSPSACSARSAAPAPTTTARAARRVSAPGTRRSASPPSA